MIRLVVQNQVNNELVELDTFGNENINLTLQVDDVRDIESKQASFSKDFNLPATKKNNKFFEHYYNVDRYTTNFNAYKNVKAFLYSDEVLVLEGFLKLLNVVDKNTEVTYNVVLFNDVANIIETLGDATINDLDFSDIAHNITASNILSSFENGVTLSTGSVSLIPFYPLINNGTLSQNSDGSITYNPYDVYILNIQLKYIIDKIFNFSGFTFTSNFFNSDLFKKIYFDTTVNTNIGDDNQTDIIQATGVDNVGSSLSVGFHPAYDLTLLNFTDEEGDDNNYFNHDTSTFQAPFDCTLVINMFVRVQSVASVNTPLNLSVATTVGGVPSYNTLDSNMCLANQTNNYQFNGQINLENGALAQIGITSPYNQDNLSHFFVPFPPNSFDFQIYLQVLPYNITEEAISSRIGDIKLADIIKDVSKLFNLTIESNGNNTLNIEPYNDYITNNVLDWTKKVNANEMVIEPIEIPKRIEFKHALEDDDYYKQQYNKRNLIEYGAQILEFDVEEQDIKTIQTEVFSAPYIQKITFTNVVCQHICAYEDGTTVPYDNKPRLVFKNNTTYTSNFNDAESFFVGTNLDTNYANATMYDDAIQNTTTSTNSLLFGLIDITHLSGEIGTQPINTLFNKYWFDYINQRYNVTNGILLKIEANLKPTDVYNFKFSDIVKIQEQHYRVNKIEYNTDKNTLAKLELLRI